ncbi:MAG TPA: uridine kinase [Rhabdochlamydiaceae bacterium]|jgi:uridine kinase|nr:uridine kinase [Rhabdochlamydiaceae bacterium]
MFRLLLILSSICLQVFASPILIGIAGGTGSGKTTMAQKIQDAFLNHSVLICQDSYYKDISHLSLEERAKTNFDHPNSLDFELMRAHLTDLMEGRAIERPVYNFQTHSRETTTQRVEPAQLIIVEGILLFAALEVRDLFNLKIFIDTDDDIRLLRRVERDLAERGRSFDGIKEQYLTTVKPMHDAFVEPSKQYADVIVPMRRQNQIALDLVITKLKSDLKKNGRKT